MEGRFFKDKLSVLGNVGIGTTDPSAKLDVNGMIKAGIAGNASANIPALLVSSAGTNTNQSAIAIQQGTNTGDTIIFADYEPYVEFGLSTDNGLDTIEFTGGTTTNNLGSKTLYNQSGNARTAYKKVIVELLSGDMSVGGKVGIGTVSPSYKLHVSGSGFTESSLNLQRTDAGGNNDPNIIFTANSSANTSVALGGLWYQNAVDNNYNAIIRARTDNNAGTSGRLDFVTGIAVGNSTVPSMVIKGDGDVGIGTTSPDERLHVSVASGGTAKIKIDSLDASRNNFIGVFNHDNLILAADDDNEGGDSSIRMSVDGSEKVRIVDNGNFGIGTVSPTTKLEILGETKSTNYRFSGSPDGGAVPAYSNSNYSTVKYNEAERATELVSSTDSSIGMAFPAFRVNESAGEQWKLWVQYKASSSTSDGFYARVYEYSSELPSNKIAVSSSASNPVVQEDTSSRTDWKTNVAISTTWVTSTYTYTPTAGAKWASIVLLNWTGMGYNSLYARVGKERFFGTSSVITGSGTVNKLPLWNGTSSLTDSIITQSSTNYVTLYGGFQVSGDHADIGSQLNLWCDSSGHGKLAVYDMQFLTGSNSARDNTALFLKTDGNVGIGTDSPAYLLSLDGDANDLTKGLLHVEHSGSYIGTSQIQQMVRLVGKSNTENSGNTPSAGVSLDFYNRWTGNAAYSVARIVGRASQGYNGGLQFDVGNNTSNGQSGFSTAMTILANSNVGIGTVSPSVKLHAVDTVTDNSSAEITRIQGTSSLGTTNTSLRFTSASSAGTATNRWFGLQAYDHNPTARALVLQHAGGNVGIGTTNPAQKLDVIGRIRSSFNLGDYFEMGSSDSGGFLLGFSGTTEVVNVRTYGDSYFNGGNVGIGTVTPVTKLHGYTGTTGARNAPIDVLTLETEHTNDVEYNGFGQGIVFRGSTYNQNSQRTLGRILHQINDDSGNTTRGTSMSFQTSDNGSNANAPTTKVTIDYKGDVGIGTASPDAKLEILSDGSAAGGAEIRLTHANNNANDVISTLNFANSNGSAAMIRGGTTGANNTGYISFFTDNAGTSSEKVRIIGDGNVGIGTLNPLFKLHVNGDIFQDVGYSIYSNANRGWYRGNYVTTGSGVSNGKIVTLNPSHGQTASSNYHYIFELTTIGTATNTGATYIGVYSADASAWSLRAVSLSGDSSNHPQLSVSGNNFTVYTNHSSNYTVVVSVTSVYNGDADSTAHSLGANYQWQRAVNDLYYNDGNVGIGNTVSQAHTNENTSTVKLRVGSDTLTSNQSSAIQIGGYDSSGNGTLGAIEFFNHRDDSIAAKIQAKRDLGSSSKLSAGQLDFYTDDGDNDLNLQMSIDALGNVGIGTAAPGYKLDVVTPASGAIHVRSTAQTHGLLMGSAAYSSGDSYVGLKTTVMTGSSDYMIISGGTSDLNTYISAADTYSVKIRGGGNNTTNEIIVTDSGNNTYSAGGFHYFQSGNIGIGVTPTQKLHVQGNLRVTGAFYDANNQAGSSGEILSSTGSGTDWVSLCQISGVTANGSQSTCYIPKWTDGTNEVLGNSVIYEDASGNIGINCTTPSYKLHVNGSFAATCKSFVIDHPTKCGHMLRYGSLESPYHGVRLTGKSCAIGGEVKVSLPHYMCGLVHKENINVQITNYRHGCTMWVDDVDISNNNFKVKTETEETKEFYWTFTAERKDVDRMQTEYKNV